MVVKGSIEEKMIELQLKKQLTWVQPAEMRTEHTVPTERS
jgi:SNF2 family DNA or RNA helicase